MNIYKFLSIHLFSLSVLLTSQFSVASDNWQQVEVGNDLLQQLYGSTEQLGDGRTKVTDSQGRELVPSCSGALKAGPGGPTPANNEFSFFVSPGDPRKLLVYFDSGGACWDANTCLSNLAPTSTFTPEITETKESMDALSAGEGGGLLSNIEGNPLSEYTRVYVPFCTADVHWGNRDTEYAFADSAGGSGNPGSFTINHRGYDNTAVVLKWLEQHYGEMDTTPARVVVAGSSAGGYGAIYHAPQIKSMLPWWTKTYLMIDGANGVISEDFYQRALGGEAISGGVWGIENSLPDVLQTAFASGKDVLSVAAIGSLAYNYPRMRIGQYSTAYDLTQSMMYNIMRNVEDPSTWIDPAYLLPSIGLWSAQARGYMHLSAAAPNYRYYIAEGIGHVVLVDLPTADPALPSPNFYHEQSAEGVALTDWVGDMVNKRWSRRTGWGGNDWINASCFPGCIAPESLPF